MIFRSLIICCYLHGIVSEVGPSAAVDDLCLTGYMTDRQSWVNATGALNVKRGQKKYTVDLSYSSNPVSVLRQKIIGSQKDGKRTDVKYLSLANCELTRIPLIYQMRVNGGRSLSQTVELMSFYGNNFRSIDLPAMEYDEFFNATGRKKRPVIDTTEDPEAANMWSSSLQQSEFPALKELDLRSCSIQVLNPYVFQGMKNLTALYLGSNEIFHIYSNAFDGLQNLLHLDLSRNDPRDSGDQPQNLITDSFLVFEELVNLESLDLSYTRLNPRNRGMIMGLQKKLKSLSICSTGLTNLEPGIFKETSLEILDISHNIQILDEPNILQGLENKLRVLYAGSIGLKSADKFKGFNRLEILRLSQNDIGYIPNTVASTLRSLQILDLNENRMASWPNMTFSLMPKLRLLILRSNNINVISKLMIEDLKEIDYLGMANNFMICNCETKDFFEMAAINERYFNDTEIVELAGRDDIYHIGFDYYNELISTRNTVSYKGKIEETGRFRLLDYEKGHYTCLVVPEGATVLVWEVLGCYRMNSGPKDLNDTLKTGQNLMLILIVIPCVLVPLLLFFMFRRNLRYFLIAMRNSAVMSLLNKETAVDDETIYNYDVFVSYCNEDRAWVLNHLLPHMEADSNISACLHERDFQVGLSILENIVLCMDRSRFIMLVLSQRFLISRWCQFEMHLAQHRLLETRREDLILVLLEDIPRRVRPNTLHYLMLTKTYIVWPKEDSERQLFFKRLKKSLLSQKNNVTRNVSLA